MKIKLLPAHLVDQIAAGEVIERPASVVKELIENSLDAGAKRIEVELADGGKQLIRITDDGHGLDFEDLPLAFASHATSKITSMEDLSSIASLGFRGEALASIGAVSRAKILSRPKGSSLGGQIENFGGQLSSASEAGAPFGTSIEVKDLFFNLPARRKFLKSASTELGQIVDLVFRTALPFEEVEFVLKHEGKELYRLPAKQGLLERIRTAFGKETVDGLLPLEAKGRAATLSGFIGLPRISRADTTRQFMYVNGRFIRDRALGRALREAYRELLPYGRQPVAFLFLNINPESVDQNVHPTKVEVRFQDSQELFRFLLHSVRDRLQAANLATPGASLRPSVPFEPREFSSSINVNEATPSYAPSVVPTRFTPPASREFYAPSRAVESAPPATLFAQASSPVHYLQIHNSYLIREIPEGFEVIDQHALHERVLYEEFREQASQGELAMQRLLVPELIDCAQADIILIEDKAELLRKAGFEMDGFGESTLAVRGVPARLKRLELKALVDEIISVAKGEEDTAKHGFLEEVLHRAACRAAVMAGDPLTQEEIQALLSKASLLAHDQTCPHSRPTRVRFTLDELERAFHRK